MPKSSSTSSTPTGHLSVPWFLRSAWRLFVTLLLIVGVPFAAFSLDVILSARSLLRQQAVDSNQAVAGLGADFVKAHFDGLVGYLESYARRPELHAALAAGDGVAIRTHLQELVDNSGSIDRVFVSDLKGIEIYDSPRDPGVIGVSFAHRDWYKTVSTRKASYVSEIYVRNASPVCQVVGITTPIRSGRGEPLAYLVAQYPIRNLIAELERIRGPNIGSIHLFDNHDHAALVPESSTAGPRDFSGVVQPLLEGPGSYRFGRDPVTSEPSLLSWRRVSNFQWLIVAQLPEEAVYAPARKLGVWFSLAALLCLAGMLGLGFVWMNVVRTHHLALLDLQRQKDLLSGMLIHDLRNPLAATLGSIDLLRAHAGEMGPLAREDVTRADRSAKRVRDLLDTLLDIMRMEEGVLTVHSEIRDLGAFVRGKADEFRPLAEAAALTLRERVPAGPLELSLDPELTGRVLDNLITNAVKHTPRGGVVEIALAADREKHRAILTVSDTGEGIPPEAMPLLFQKFAPISGQELKRPHDVGLGLVFCRMAIELQGGTIEARSEVGRGTVLHIALPLPSAPAVFAQPRSRASGWVS